MNEPNRETKDKLWTPTFVMIIIVALMAFMTTQGLNAGTTIYIDRTGGTALFSGYLASAFSVMAGVARLTSGALMDVRGRRVFILGGAILLFVSTLGPLAIGGDTAMIVWRVLQGAGFGTITTAISTAAADVLPIARLGEGIGYFGLGQALAMAIGPAFAIGLATMEPPELIFCGLAVTAGVALVFALIANYEKNPLSLPETSAFRKRWEEKNAAQSQREAASAAVTIQEDVQEKARHESFVSRIFERGALAGAIPFCFINPVFGFCIYFVALYGTTLGVGNPGLYFTFTAISMIAVRLKSGSFMDRVDSIVVYTVAVIGGTIACVMLIVSGTFAQDAGFTEPVFYAAGIAYGLCTGLSMPVCQTVAVKGTPPERWGAANGLFLLSQDVGICIAVIIWGAINDAFGFQASLVGCILCIAASYVAAWICFPPRRKRAGK